MKVLIVDDDAATRVYFSRRLKKEGWEMVAVSNVAEALDSLKGNGFDAAVIDVNLGESVDGVCVAQKARDMKPEMKIVMMSGDETNQARIESSGFGSLMIKPVEMSDLISRLTH